MSRGVVHVLMNQPRMRAILSEAGIDGLIATSFSNVLYLTNFYSMGQLLIQGTQVYGVANREALEESLVVTGIFDTDMAIQTGFPEQRVITHGYFPITHAAPGSTLDEGNAALKRLVVDTPVQGSALEGLLAAVKQAGLVGATIGLDESGLSPQLFQQICEALPAKVVPAARLFKQVRMVKTPAEIARLRKAAQATEVGIAASLAACKAGVTELEVANVFERTLVEQGCRPGFTVFGFGSHTVFPNAMPSDRKLVEGDTIRWDVGAISDFYWSDMSRMAYLGEPDAKTAGYYKAILEGELAALAVVKAGVKANEVFHAAIETTRKAGIPHYTRHHVGHGIGMDIYDMPSLSATDETVLEAGMVLCVETPYYELGYTGLQVEDIIVVTEDGFEFLTVGDRNLLRA